MSPELPDIMPTLLECAGLPCPESVEGRSFLSLAQGRPCAWRKFLQGEHTYRDQALHYVTDGHWKHIWFSGSGREQFFDLDGDPQELRDLGAQSGQSGRISEFRRALIEELTGREEGFTDGARLIPGRPVGPVLKSRIPDQG